MCVSVCVNFIRLLQERDGVPLKCSMHVPELLFLSRDGIRQQPCSGYHSQLDRCKRDFGEPNVYTGVCGFVAANTIKCKKQEERSYDIC